MGSVSIGALILESGHLLEEVELAYERSGPKDAPVIVLCHALTGNQFALGTKDSPGWWSGLAGHGKYIDTTQYQTISFNVLGGCHGSTGPSSINPRTNNKYGTDFPHVTIRDLVRSQHLALHQLGINKVKALAGGSLGGMQVLEWGLLYPDQMDELYMLAATPYLTDYGIAFNRIGIAAIESDPNWENGNYKSSSDVKGFEVARMAGMITYRSDDLFSSRYNREKINNRGDKPLYQIESYLNYQGKKIGERFDVNSYLYLLYAMNDHDIGEGRGGWENAVKEYQVPLITISFEKDLIYPPPMIEGLSEKVPKSTYYNIPTQYGHDGFLTEFFRWGPIIEKHLNER